MQQGIKAGDTLWLRFKYYSFFDLDPKVGRVREKGGWVVGHGGSRVEGLGSAKVRHLWESAQLSVCGSTPPLGSSTNMELGPRGCQGLFLKGCQGEAAQCRPW